MQQFAASVSSRLSTAKQIFSSAHTISLIVCCHCNKIRSQISLKSKGLVEWKLCPYKKYQAEQKKLQILRNKMAKWNERGNLQHIDNPVGEFLIQESSYSSVPPTSAHGTPFWNTPPLPKADGTTIAPSSLVKITNTSNFRKKIKLVQSLRF